MPKRLHHLTRNIKAQVLVGSCLFLMIGCETATQKHISTLTADIQASEQRAYACLQKIETNPAFLGISKHTPLSGRMTPNIQQLADDTIPTEEESKVIVALHNELSQCRARGIEDFMKTVPSLVSIFVPAYLEGDLITVELIKRKITWGEANKRKAAIKNETMTKGHAEVQRLHQAYARSHEAELQQRQAAMNALSNWAQQQQLLMQNQQFINTLNRPVMTNCTGVGRSIQCTSF